MAAKYCASCGEEFGYEPRYYCTECDAFYHYKCLKGGTFSQEQCPYYHGYNKLRRIEK
jgi:hypothetical protein